MADGGADVAGDAFFFFCEDTEAGEAGVDVHEGGEWACEAAPDAAGEVEVDAIADGAGEPEIDDVFVGEGRVFLRDAGDKLVDAGLREDPAGDAEGEDDEADGEDGLADHVHFVPEGAVGHFVAVVVAEGFRHGAAGADPSAVGALAPAPDDEREDDEGLDEAEDEPAPEWCLGEDVVDEEGPCKDEAECAPVFGGLGAGSVGEEGHAEPFSEAAVGEGAVGAEVGEEDVGEEEEWDDLEGGEGSGLEFYVGSSAAADAADAEDDDDGGVEEGKEEAGIVCGGLQGCL